MKDASYNYRGKNGKRRFRKISYSADCATLKAPCSGIGGLDLEGIFIVIMINMI